MDGSENQPAPTTTNPSPEVQQSDVPQTDGGQGAAPAGDAPTTDGPKYTPEQLADIDKFFRNNGGFEAVKSKLSNPQKNIPEQPTQATQPAPEQQPQQPVEPQHQQIKGGMTYEEFMAAQYFDHLANEKEFEPIADQIRSGDIFKEMKKFNIRPTIDGQFNDGQVRDFLSLMAKTVPPKQTQVEPTTTPTVEYVEVGEKITSMADVNKIIAQNAQLRASGMAEHPLTNEAKKFMAEHFKNRK